MISSSAELSLFHSLATLIAWVRFETTSKPSWGSNQDDITIFFLLGRGLPIETKQ